MATPTNSYLTFCAIIATFRALVYIVNLEYVSKVKCAPEFWEFEEIENNSSCCCDIREADVNRCRSTPIREVFYAYTKTIRLMMLFKATVFWWGSYCLKESVAKDILSLISFVFDLQLMWAIYFQFKSPKNLVLNHQNVLAPALLQLSLVLAGFYFLREIMINLLLLWSFSL